MRIAMDTGGTFTDCVYVLDGRLEILKVPSTPDNPARAIVHALEKVMAAPADALELTCGTTVGTNALLERRGGRVALVTTGGFEDVLEIGRQARPRLYDFFVDRPAPLVPAERRIGLRERIGASGEVVTRTTPGEIRRVVKAVLRSKAESAAVCLLFSFANPSHERQIAKALRGAGLQVSVSHEILPEFREFERTSTTVANAYLVPVMSRYLGQLVTDAARFSRRDARPAVRIMQSSGGIVSAEIASREPVRTILSGPAGGILGAQYVARLSGFDRIITFDMGGTSTDVALLEGGLATTNEARVADLPVAVPMLEIHTVGAGGGSIARFDGAGALRVGPESAGAAPGPICYGRGEKPTVTDAHLILGHIPERGFLSGEFPLHAQRARDWMERSRGQMRTAEQFAQGIVDVANAVMEKAIRVISVERGHDPRDYTLVAFGGAGGLHACDLAGALRIPRVLVPRYPGGLSALGILRADVIHDYSRTIQTIVATVAATRRALASDFKKLEAAGRRVLAQEGFNAGRIRIERLLDMRYVGQAYELTVPEAGDFLGAFHRAHERRYGYSDPARQAEVVNIRARAIGVTAKPDLDRLPSKGKKSGAAITETRQAFFNGRKFVTKIYDRAELTAGASFKGPAIITEYSATTVLPPGWSGSVDGWGNLNLSDAKRNA
ncbi:MAG TPA: hydantoinase/oxoprolinase family protein [Candidatus Acidoferrales bacterium]|jgi:N-methylhydantoinase A|nr:hydantoinase/oxoprolinase family protein [Candidatus Acidoferrales bacterium]